MSPNAGGGGSCGVSAMSTAEHRSPSKLWRSTTSIFNLWVPITVPGLPSLEVFQCSLFTFWPIFLAHFKLKTGGRIGPDSGRCPPWSRRVGRRRDPSRPSYRSGCSAPGRTSEKKTASRDDRFKANLSIYRYSILNTVFNYLVKQLYLYLYFNGCWSDRKTLVDGRMLSLNTVRNFTVLHGGESRITTKWF